MIRLVEIPGACLEIQTVCCQEDIKPKSGKFLATSGYEFAAKNFGDGPGRILRFGSPACTQEQLNSRREKISNDADVDEYWFKAPARGQCQSCTVSTTVFSREILVAIPAILSSSKNFVLIRQFGRCSLPVIARQGLLY